MQEFPTNEEMLKSIELSGYLMEQEIATILEKRGYVFRLT